MHPSSMYMNTKYPARQQQPDYRLQGLDNLDHSVLEGLSS